MANRLLSYFIESRQELRKVAWPSWRETRNTTIIVVVISLFVALFLGLIDVGLAFVIRKTVG